MIIVENRIPEASALRIFFGEQLVYLKHLFSLSYGDGTKGSEQAQLSNAIEHIVDNVDSRIRGVSSYKKKLRNSARILLGYVEDIVKELPPTILMNRDSYVNVPFINAVFSSNNEISQLIKQSEEVEQFLKTYIRTSDFGLYAPDFYALLLLWSDKKQIYGNDVTGDIIQKDVLQTAVNFQGHQLISPVLHESDIRSALERVIFDKTISALNSELVKMRHNLTEKERIEAAMNPLQSINNPLVYLKLLTERLGHPEKIVRLTSQSIKLSKMGILLEESSTQPFNTMTVTELEIGEGFKKTVAFLKFERGEWLT